MSTQTALNQYNQINAQGKVEDANAYKLIQMLLAGALDKIATAKGCMMRKDIDGKGSNISAAISIVDGLQASLDREKGGEIAENLYNLYNYIMQRLLQANIEDSTDMLDEVGKLIATIKSGWDGIEKEANEILSKGKASD